MQTFTVPPPAGMGIHWQDRIDLSKITPLQRPLCLLHSHPALEPELWTFSMLKQIKSLAPLTPGCEGTLGTALF